MIPQITFPDKMMDEYNRMKNAKNPNRQELLDLYDDFVRVNKALIIKKVRTDLTQGKYNELFNGKKYDKVKTLDEMKKLIGNDLREFRIKLPNLYNYLYAHVKINLKSISTLDECNNLRSQLTKFCQDYAKFYKLDLKWYGSLSKNFGMDNYLKTTLKTYFEMSSPELGFTKNMGHADADTIKAYIKSEMRWLETHDIDFYRYYMKNIFNDSMSIDEYLTNFEKDLTPMQYTSQYRNLYKSIQDTIKPSRDILKSISGKIMKMLKWIILLMSLERLQVLV